MNYDNTHVRKTTFGTIVSWKLLTFQSKIAMIILVMAEIKCSKQLNSIITLSSQVFSTWGITNLAADRSGNAQFIRLQV